MRNLLRIREVAELLNIDRGQVGDLIRSGRLRAINVSLGTTPRWRIDPIELERFKASCQSQPPIPRAERRKAARLFKEFV